MYSSPTPLKVGNFMCASISSSGGGGGVAEFLPIYWFESGVARGLSIASYLTEK